MAREYARVKVTIWADTDFRNLTDRAQALYFRLLSSPTMSLCGVADWRPKRIAALTRGMTAAGVVDAAEELSERGYVVVDDETEEVLIRSFVRHDGLIKTPNIAAAMAKDYAGTASELLRGVIVFELLRMKQEEPEMKGWATASHLLREPSIDPLEIPSDKASGMPSVMPLPIPSDKASGNGSHIPQPASLNPQPSSSKKSSSARKRATKQPEGWKPNEGHRELARDLGVSTAGLVEQFSDHHAAKGSTFIDWDAAFRTWIRNAAKFSSSGGTQREKPRAEIDLSYYTEQPARRDGAA